MTPETDRPIENVNVFDGATGATTDSYGMCSIEIFQKDENITFSMIGYKPVTLPYDEILKSVSLKSNQFQWSQ